VVVPCGGVWRQRGSNGDSFRGDQETWRACSDRTHSTGTQWLGPAFCTSPISRFLAPASRQSSLSGPSARVPPLPAAHPACFRLSTRVSGKRAMETIPLLPSASSAPTRLTINHLRHHLRLSRHPRALPFRIPKPPRILDRAHPPRLAKAVGYEPVRAHTSEPGGLDARVGVMALSESEGLARGAVAQEGAGVPGRRSS
jgi:hypothetical protein